MSQRGHKTLIQVHISSQVPLLLTGFTRAEFIVKEIKGVPQKTNNTIWWFSMLEAVLSAFTLLKIQNLHKWQLHSGSRESHNHDCVLPKTQQLQECMLANSVC